MITFKVTPDDGAPYKVTATSRDVLTWEKTTRDKTFNDFLENPDYPNAFKLAHFACWRQGLYKGSLAEFEKTCEVVGVGADEEEEEGEPDPTQAGPSIELASPSPSEPASAPASGRRKASGR